VSAVLCTGFAFSLLLPLRTQFRSARFLAFANTRSATARAHSAKCSLQTYLVKDTRMAHYYSAFTTLRDRYSPALPVCVAP
jgi:hypothetical protein